MLPTVAICPSCGCHPLLPSVLSVDCCLLFFAQWPLITLCRSVADVDTTCGNQLAAALHWYQCWCLTSCFFNFPPFAATVNAHQTASGATNAITYTLLPPVDCCSLHLPCAAAAVAGVHRCCYQCWHCTRSPAPQHCCSCCVSTGATGKCCSLLFFYVATVIAIKTALWWP